MPIEDRNEFDRVDREIRVNELKHRLGAVDAEISEDCPPEVAEGFINSIERAGGMLSPLGVSMDVSENMATRDCVA